MQSLIGIDIGTSSCKATLITVEGVVIATATVRYSDRAGEAAVRYPQRDGVPGASERPVADFWSAVCEVSRILSGEAPEAMRAVVACAVSGQMRGVVCLDGDAEPVRDAVLWNDNRCRTQLAGLSPSEVEWIEGLTRNPLNTMCTLPKLLWMRENEPDLLGGTATLLFPKDYITFRLTGNLSTDVSDASGSSLYLPESAQWSPQLAERAGIALDQLPGIHESCERVGLVTERASEETRIPAGVPVAAGMSDSTAEMLALGITESGAAKIRLGTSGAVSVLSDSLPRPGAKVYCWSFLDGHHWMLDINTRSCAASVDWARRVFYHEIASDEVAYAVMADEAAGVQPGAGGVIFRPHLGGEDAPYWDAGLTGSLTGLDASHGRAEITRAIYEGTAFALREALEASATELGTPREFRFTGGGARNSVWVSIVAAVLGVTGTVGEAGGASLGAALCAGVAGGVFADAANAAAVAGQAGGDAVMAEQGTEGAYEEHYRRYRATEPQRLRTSVAQERTGEQ